MPGAGSAAAAAAAAAAFAAAASPMAASPPTASPPLGSASNAAAAATAASCWTPARVKQEPCALEGEGDCRGGGQDADTGDDDDRSRSPAVDDSGISPGRSSSTSGGVGEGAGDGGDGQGGGGGGSGDSAGPSPERPPLPWPPAADVPICVQLQLQAADSPLRRLQNALARGAMTSTHMVTHKMEPNGWDTTASMPAHYTPPLQFAFGGGGPSPPHTQPSSPPSFAPPTPCSVSASGAPSSPGDEPMDVTDADADGDMCTGDEEPGLREPRVNAQGKVKTYRCKQCPFVAVTKLDFWDHSRTHIKQEKMLTCPKCPFVTEYKHHLEYHLRNHYGSKPFKCDKCPYTCVNKSMLNSHMKSHSSVYQYRCADCSYATKYMHSLKLHLRKYTHKPAMVLNPDGSPNPLPIIDVYGTRRGPKTKPTGPCAPPARPDANGGGGCADAAAQRFPGAGAFPAHAAFLLRPPPPLAYAYNPFLPSFSPFAALAGADDAAAEATPARLSPTQLSPAPAAPPVASAPPAPVVTPPTTAPPPPPPQAAEPVDLSRGPEHVPEPTPEPSAAAVAAAKANRRKGKAYKLERVPLALSSEDEHEGPGGSPPPRGPQQESFHCSYCGITFRDVVMYTMHMGYHGYADPFTCNMCGHATTDRVSFFLHIARSPHC